MKLKIDERILKKLIKESLIKNLLFERVSDEKYDIIANFIIEILKNPKDYLYPHGRLKYKNSVLLNASDGKEIVTLLDFRYTNSSYSKILDLVTKYFSIKRNVPDLSSNEKIFWLENIEADFLNKFSEAKGTGIEFSKIKPLYAFTIKRSKLNLLGMDLYEKIGIGTDGFMKYVSIKKLLNDLKFILYPDLDNAGGSMSADGSFNFNCYYWDPKFQKNTSQMSPTPPPGWESSLKPTPSPKLTENVAVPPSIKPLLMSVIDKLNEYGQSAVMQVINWLYVKDETFLEYLKTTDLSILISHEIGHYINAIRANKNTGKDVHYRDSGLKDDKNFTPGTTGYQLSTEELQARYIHLRNEIKSDIDKIINFNSIIDSTNKTIKEKQSDFLNSTNGIFPANSGNPDLRFKGSFYKNIFSFLFDDEKSKAVNFTIRGEEKTIPPPPGTNGLPTNYLQGNFIKSVLLVAAGPDESVWETAKGKKYLGRVYNRIADLIDYIDDILKDKNLK